MARLEPATEAELRTVSDGVPLESGQISITTLSVGDATFATFTDADMSVAATLVVKDCPHANAPNAPASPYSTLPVVVVA